MKKRVSKIQFETNLESVEVSITRALITEIPLETVQFSVNPLAIVRWIFLAKEKNPMGSVPKRSANSFF